MRKLVLIILFCFAFSLGVKAEETDLYGEQYEISGAEEIKDFLDDETKDFLEKNNLDPKNPDWVNSLSQENIFSHIIEFVKSGAKAPAKAAAAIMGIILITAAVTSFGDPSGRFAPALFAATLAVAGIVAADIWGVISSTAEALRGTSYFMISFIPVFVGIVSLSGGVITSASMGALLIGGAEAVSSLASFFVLPAMGSYLSISICSTVSPVLNGANIGAAIKKVTLWTLSFVTTLFLGILSIQTAVNSSADSVSIRTARFILGSSVPFAGNTLAEALTTVTASVSLLKTSVGIYGVVALAVMFIPVILELILWRITLLLTGTVATAFSLPKISGLLKAVDDMISLLLAAVLLIAGMFIISLTVIVTVGKA